MALFKIAIVVAVSGYHGEEHRGRIGLFRGSLKPAVQSCPKRPPLVRRGIRRFRCMPCPASGSGCETFV